MSPSGTGPTTFATERADRLESRHSPRYTATVVVLSFCASGFALFGPLVAEARAQTEHANLLGSDAGDGLGSAVGGAGDVDADGRDDLVVGVPGDDTNGDDAGLVRVYSGASGTLLHEFLGGNAGDRFGESVDLVGDVDDDGHDDIVIGAPFDDGGGGGAGSVQVFSGDSGAVVWTRYGSSAGDAFGYSVAGVGDLDGDGSADVIVGAPGTGGNGSAFAIAGATGIQLFEVQGIPTDNGLGFDVDGVPDADGDGIDDLVLGVPGDYAVGIGAGSVRLVSGADGALLFRFDGEFPGDLFGSAVSGAGDVDADGFGDVVAAGRHTGFYVRVYSGASGAKLHEFFPGAQGSDVSGAGDVDGDGFDDILIGAPTVGGSGRAFVHSGVDGSLLCTMAGDHSGDRFGEAVSNAGDVNGDLFADLFVGAPEADWGDQGAGMATAYSCFASAECVRIRSGQSGGQPGDPPDGSFGGDVDDTVRQWSSSACCVPLSSSPFTAADFAAADSGLFAELIVPYPGWVQELELDPAARWIDWAHDGWPFTGSGSVGSVLYSMEFEIETPGDPHGWLQLDWAVDDRLGDVPGNGPNPMGAYLNGQPLSGAFVGGSGETIAIQEDVPLLTGTNTLHLYQHDAGGYVSGILFSARVCVDAGPLGDFPGEPFCLGDQSGIACPCANFGSEGEGCANSTGRGAVLTASGTAEVVAHDLVFTIEGARPNESSLLVQGEGATAFPFRDGILCTAPPTDRLEVVFLDGTGAGSTVGSISTSAGVVPGQTRYYQVWYRDPDGISPCGTGSNFTSGLIVEWW